MKDKNVRAFVRSLLMTCLDDGFNSFYPLERIVERAVLLQGMEPGITPVQLYDNETNTGLLWEHGPYGSGYMDFHTGYGGKTYVSVNCEYVDMLGNWSREPYKAELMSVETAEDGPGEEDGPWAPGWNERAGLTSPFVGNIFEEEPPITNVNKVVIVVAGGVVQDVYSNDPDLQVELYDHDNVEAGPEGHAAALEEMANDAIADLNGVYIGGPGEEEIEQYIQTKNKL